MSTNVFVSYSHADSSLVSPVVKLLRVNKSLVFQDIDTIQPGKRWRGEIDKALSESHLVVVFWCTHASGSNEVSKEWRAAVELKKDLLPLLLDTTPLPQELAEFQWIDFRGTVGPNHSSIEIVNLDETDGPPPMAETASWSVRPLLLAAGTVVFCIATAFAWWLLPHAVVPTSFPLPTPTATHPLPKAGMPNYYLWSLLLVGIVVAVIARVILLRRRYRKPQAEDVRRYGRIDQRYPGGIAQYIASEVEAEILGRTILRRESGK